MNKIPSSPNPEVATKKDFFASLKQIMKKIVDTIVVPEEEPQRLCQEITHDLVCNYVYFE